MFANVTIFAAANHAAVGVPKRALIYEGDEVRVWVVHDDKSIELRKIKAGLTNSDLVEVVGNLHSGERIVTKGNLMDHFADGAGNVLDLAHITYGYLGDSDGYGGTIRIDTHAPDAPPAPQLARGELETVLDEFALPDYDILAVYPQQRYVPAKVRYFIDYLKDVYARDDYWSGVA